MSAYSDWRVGALSDDEYRQECEYEARKDAYLAEKEFEEYMNPPETDEYREGEGDE